MWPCDELVLVQGVSLPSTPATEEAGVENGRLCLEEAIPDYLFFLSSVSTNCHGSLHKVESKCSALSADPPPDSRSVWLEVAEVWAPPAARRDAIPGLQRTTATRRATRLEERAASGRLGACCQLLPPLSLSSSTTMRLVNWRLTDLARGRVSGNNVRVSRLLSNPAAPPGMCLSVLGNVRPD